MHLLTLKHAVTDCHIEIDQFRAAGQEHNIYEILNVILYITLKKKLIYIFRIYHEICIFKNTASYNA